MVSFLASLNGYQTLNDVKNCETNGSRSSRDVVLLLEKLETIGTAVNFYSAKEKAPAEARMHWKIRVGPYTHQLHTDRLGLDTFSRSNTFGSEAQSLPDHNVRYLGSTSLTDLEIDNLGKHPSLSILRGIITNVLMRFSTRC